MPMVIGRGLVVIVMALLGGSAYAGTLLEDARSSLEKWPAGLFGKKFQQYPWPYAPRG